MKSLQFKQLATCITHWGEFSGGTLGDGEGKDVVGKVRKSWGGGGKGCD